MSIAQRYARPVSVDPATAAFHEVLVAFVALVRHNAPSVVEHPKFEMGACAYLGAAFQDGRGALSLMPDNAARWRHLIVPFLERWELVVSRLPA